MSGRRCLLCELWFEAKRRGRSQVFCSGKCRQRAYRLKLVSVPVPVELGEPVELGSVSAASTFVEADHEMMEHAAEVVRRADAIEAANRRLIAESDGLRSVWRYCDPDEDEVLEAAEGYRTYTEVDLWAD